MGLGNHLASIRVRLGGPLFVLLGQAAQSVSTFLTSLLIARWGGQSELGYYAIAYSFCFLVICLCDALLATPYTYFYSAHAEQQRAMLRAAFCGSLILALVIGTSVPLLYLGGVESLESVVGVLPLTLLAFSLREIFRRHLHVAGKLTVAFCNDALSSVLQVVLICALAATDNLSASTALMVVTVAVMFPTFIFFKHLEIGKSDGNGDMGHWLHQYLLYGRWLVLGTACHVAGVQLYPWLALASGGPLRAGSFAACMALANLLNPLLIGLTNYFRPRFMERYRSLTPALFVRYVVRVGAFFVGPAVVFVALALCEGEALLGLFYGEEYEGGAQAFFYLAQGGLFIALGAPLQLALLAARVPITNLFYHATVLLLSLLASFLTWDFLTLNGLSYIYAGVNLAGVMVLSFFFWVRVVHR